MEPRSEPFARAEMLIRRPAAEVFAAFADPVVTTRFWFTRSSGKLAPGARVTWEWEMFGYAAEVEVKEVEADRRIVVEWPGQDNPSTVEWTFTARPDGSTFVRITNTGFTGDEREIAEAAIGSTEGFTLVLAGLKALLEHGVDLNLIADRFPDTIVPGWTGRRPA